MSETVIGFIGYGELASTLAQGLIKNGLQNIWAYDKVLETKSEAEARVRAKITGDGIHVAETPEELAANVEIMLSTVTPAVSLHAANAFAPVLSVSHFYADLNSCTPNRKIEAEQIIKASGARYVDVAVVGGATFQGFKIPCLACGEAAAAFYDALTPYGLNVTVIEGPVGTASRIKMLRSVVQKGIEALMLEMLVAAEQYDLEDVMMDSVAETFDRGNFKQYINALLTTHALHAGRRSDEMEMVKQTVNECGIEPLVTEGVLNLFSHSAGLQLANYFNHNLPGDYKDVTSAIRKLTS